LGLVLALHAFDEGQVLRRFIDLRDPASAAPALQFLSQPPPVDSPADTTCCYLIYQQVVTLGRVKCQAAIHNPWYARSVYNPWARLSISSLRLFRFIRRSITYG